MTHAPLIFRRRHVQHYNKRHSSACSDSYTRPLSFLAACQLANILCCSQSTCVWRGCSVWWRVSVHSGLARAFWAPCLQHTLSRTGQHRSSWSCALGTVHFQLVISYAASSKLPASVLTCCISICRLQRWDLALLQSFGPSAASQLQAAVLCTQDLY